MSVHKIARVLFHRGCTDGEVSHWIAKTALTQAGYKVESYPVNYEDDFKPLLALPSCDSIYILDFSLSLNDTEMMRQKCRKFVWLDHHETAAENHGGYGLRCVCHNGVFRHEELRKERSGCGLTWNFFAEQDEFGFTLEHPYLSRVRKVVHLVEDRDLWKFEHGDETRAMHMLINAEKISYERLDRLFHLNQDAWIDECYSAQCKFALRKEYIQQWSSKPIARSLRLGNGQTIDILTVNCPSNFASEVGEAVYEKTPEMAVMAYSIGDKVYASLRSKAGIGPDVSTIAKHFGGGGHVNAAGFSMSNPVEFFNLFA